MVTNWVIQMAPWLDSAWVLAKAPDLEQQRELGSVSAKERLKVAARERRMVTGMVNK